MKTFNMQEIGRKISALRKGKNMTQMDMADRLGISFQAVSNWERGLTMPDISKLPEIAELFGVTVDEILGDKTAANAVTDICGGSVPENLDGETLAAVAPILKPDQLKKTVDENKKSVDLTSLTALAPYLDCDELYDMILSLTKDGGLSCSAIVLLAPYLDCDDVGKLVLKAIEEGERSAHQLIALAPYMDYDDVGKAAIKLIDRGGESAEITSLAPYMDCDDVGKLAMKLAQKDNGSAGQIVALAPYMDGDDLKKVIKTLIKNGNADSDSIKKIIELA